MQLVLLILLLINPIQAQAASRSNVADIQLFYNGVAIKDNSVVSNCSDDCSLGVCKGIVMPRECVFYRLKDDYASGSPAFSKVDYPDSKALYKVKVNLPDAGDCARGDECKQTYRLDMATKVIRTVEGPVDAMKYGLLAMALAGMAGVAWFKVKGKH